MTEVALQICAGVFLAIIIGLMTYMTSKVVDILTRITAVETDIKNISEDLQKSANHTASIAVLDNNVTNMKIEIRLLFEKLRDLERR